MLQKVKHSKSLPTHITTHQMMDVSKRIHQLVSGKVAPLVETTPKYEALNQTLGQLRLAIDQLQSAHTQRKFKGTRQMRGVGSVDGVTDDTKLSDQKRKAYQQRAAQMKRFRLILEWNETDSAALADVPTQAAARVIRLLLDKRLDRFERLSYEESATEFGYFFEEIENSPAALDALPVLDLTKVYDALKNAQSEFDAIHDTQTLVDAIHEEKPKVPASSSDLRQVVRVVLTMLHFDVASGDNTLAEVLGHVDEMIDKIRAVGKRRRTLDEQAAAADTDDTDDNTVNDTGSATATASSDAGDAPANEPVGGGDTDPPAENG